MTKITIETTQRRQVRQIIIQVSRNRIKWASSWIHLCGWASWMMRRTHATTETSQPILSLRHIVNWIAAINKFENRLAK